MLDVMRGYLPLTYIDTHCGSRGARLAVSPDVALLAAAARTSPRSKVGDGNIAFLSLARTWVWLLHKPTSDDHCEFPWLTLRQVFVAVFETGSFAMVYRLQTSAPALRQLKFLQIGRTLLATTSDGRLLMWDLASGGKAPLPRSRQLASGAFAVDEGLRFIAGGGADGLLKLWRLDWTVRFLHKPRYIGNQLPTLCLSPGLCWQARGATSIVFGTAQQKSLLSCCRWQGHCPRFVPQEGQEAALPSLMLQGNCGDITAVACTPGGQLISTDSHGSITIWESASRHLQVAAPIVEPSSCADGSALLPKASGSVPRPEWTAQQAKLQPSSLPGGQLCRSPTADCSPAPDATIMHRLDAAANARRALSFSDETADRRLPVSHSTVQPSPTALAVFNGAAGSTVVWRPATGLLAYASADAVVIEDLDSGQQRCRCTHPWQLSLPVMYERFQRQNTNVSGVLYAQKRGLWHLMQVSAPLHRQHCHSTGLQH